MSGAERVGRWLDGSGPESGVAVSTRVRLARNLDDVAFTGRVGVDEQARVVEAVRWSLQEAGYLDAGTGEAGSSPQFLDDEQLTEERGRLLFERHLVSADFIGSRLRRGLYVAGDESLSLMVNEEDHLRLQALVSGLNMPAAYELAARLDERLENDLGYAFLPEYGYLTACPTNLGTGMRASVLVHLPGLVLTRAVEKILRGAVQVGLVVRGLHGEGTETRGNFFQISNQKTLGVSETEVLEQVTDMSRQVVEHEQKAREYLVENLRVEIEDKVFRSLALLRSARVLSSDEATNLLANVRFGVALGIINEIKLELVNRLLVLVRPENLQAVLNERLKPEARDERRASFVRETLVRPGGER
ncbi:MAG: protein arginine kinase [bacterium]